MRRCSCCRLQSWKWNPCQLRWARCCGVWVVRAVARRSVDPFYTLYFFFTERKKENTEIQNLAQVQRSPPRDRECIPKRTSRDLGRFLDFWMRAVTASLPYVDQFSTICPGILHSEPTAAPRPRQNQPTARPPTAGRGARLSPGPVPRRRADAWVCGSGCHSRRCFPSNVLTRCPPTFDQSFCVLLQKVLGPVNVVF